MTCRHAGDYTTFFCLITEMRKLILSVFCRSKFPLLISRGVFSLRSDFKTEDTEKITIVKKNY